MKLSLALLFILIFTACASKQKVKTPTEKKAEIYYNEGTRNLVRKEYTKALKRLLKANELSPDDSRICNNLGMALYFKKSTSRAIKYIKKSIGLDQKNTDAKMNLATIYMEIGKTSLSKSLYLKVLDDLTYEGQHRTYYNLGILSLRERNSKEAKKYLKKSLEVDSAYCPANFQLGNIYYHQKQYNKAYDRFKDAALGVCYSNPEPQVLQAKTLLKLGKYSQASLKLEEIIERFPRTKYARLASKKLVSIRHLVD